MIYPSVLWGVSRDSASFQEARGQAIEVVQRMHGPELFDEERPESSQEEKLEATYQAMVDFKRQKREEVLRTTTPSG